MKTLIKTTLIAFTVVMMAGVGNVQASEVTGTISSSGGGSGATVVAAPVASPAVGSYTSTRITLTATNADIRYLIDSTVKPTCSTGTLYTGAISVSTSQVISALSCYSTGASSDVATFAYIINISTPPPHTGGGGGGTYTPPTTPPALAQADFNSDGKVDITDFNILINHWGTESGATKVMGDANGDGKVDIIDFNILINNWPTA